ncbi:unnamed protein product [Lathyrus sativus]|nr:unnamed protein product [Lathyrus sativus]
MSITSFLKVSLVAEVDTNFKCIKLFLKGISFGRDDLRAQHILDALCRQDSTVSRDLLYAITPAINLWLGGRCLVSLTEFAASAPLTSLLKCGAQIRPIVMSSIDK